MVAEFDHTLETGARALAAFTEREGNLIELDYSPDHMPAFGEDADDPEYFELRLPDGTVVAKSPSLGDGTLPAVIPSPASPLFSNTTSPDGTVCRMIQRVFVPQIEPKEEEADSAEEDEPFVLFEVGDGEAEYLVVCVARSRSDLDTMLLSIYGVILGVDLLLLGAIAVLVRRSVSKSLQPLSDINSQVASIGADALHNRVSINSPPVELETIIAAINELLQRVERAFERERQFSSDVAHELRTPVSELKTACEVGQRWPDDPESIQQFFNDVREIAAPATSRARSSLVVASSRSHNCSPSLENLSRKASAPPALVPSKAP
jgi:signal transduction histidine kinase